METNGSVKSAYTQEIHKETGMISHMPVDFDTGFMWDDEGENESDDEGESDVSEDEQEEGQANVNPKISIAEYSRMVAQARISSTFPFRGEPTNIADDRLAWILQRYFHVETREEVDAVFAWISALPKLDVGSWWRNNNTPLSAHINDFFPAMEADFKSIVRTVASIVLHPSCWRFDIGSTSSTKESLAKRCSSRSGPRQLLIVLRKMENTAGNALENQLHDYFGESHRKCIYPHYCGRKGGSSKGNTVWVYLALEFKFEQVITGGNRDLHVGPTPVTQPPKVIGDDKSPELIDYSL